MSPPREFYDQGTVLWKLEKALNGRRPAPRAWRDRLAELLHTHSLTRTQSEANVYMTIGTAFARKGDVVYMRSSSKHVHGILQRYGLAACKAAATAGASAPSSKAATV